MRSESRSRVQSDALGRTIAMDGDHPRYQRYQVSLPHTVSLVVGAYTLRASLRAHLPQIRLYCSNGI